MKKKKLIIIGKKSFIGSNIYNFLKRKKKISILSFEDFMKLPNKIISNYDYVCNCAVNKNSIKRSYKSSYDCDLKIAKKIEKIPVNYIFLSSRKVYKPKFNINESSKIQPIDKDSKNKIITERNLIKKLKSKLLILRISNVIGLKTNKKNRRIHKTFLDNYLEMVKKNDNVKFYNLFKDFITINQLSKIFELILKKKLNGIFNVSRGQKIYIKEIIKWLNHKNPNKEKFICMNENKNILDKYSFTLNNLKLYKKIKYKPTKKDLKTFCLKLSGNIH